MPEVIEQPHIAYYVNNKYNILQPTNKLVLPAAN